MMSHSNDTEKPNGLTGEDATPAPPAEAQAPADEQTRPEAQAHGCLPSQPDGQAQPDAQAHPEAHAHDCAPSQPDGSKALTLTVAGRTVVFVDPPGLDFALFARTRVSAEAQAWFYALEPDQLDGELLWVRRAKRQSERLLRERYAGRDARLEELLPEQGAFSADEFGWSEIIQQLAQASRTERGFADVALVRFSEYLDAREAALVTARRQLRPEQRAPVQAEESVGVAPATPSHPLDPLLHTEDGDAAFAESWLADLGRQSGLEALHAPTAEPNLSVHFPAESESCAAGSAGPSRSSGPVSDDSPKNEGLALPLNQPQRLMKGKREEVQMENGQPLVLFCGSSQITLVDESTLINANGVAHRLAPGPNVIGRDPACDLVLEGHQISRMHVVVVSHGNGRYSLTDLSRNGTWWLRAGETTA